MGLRILSLDGGGTRGLSTLYVLREMMNRVVPNNGGDIRPSEYFDIIGASGPNALLALLFVRFAFNINEAQHYFHEFARRMDNAELIFETETGEGLDEDDWAKIALETPEPEVQMETCRRQIVSNTWSELITRQITDWLERSKYKEGGEFNFKAPSANVGVGRCRAAVMGSESTGHGPNGGVDKTRLYHAPIWHRSYQGRHVSPTYTLYAIALGTLASPGICSNGLLFQDFSAPGSHSVHNPVQLLLEECRKIWPGLKPELVLSIGTGKVDIPDEWDEELHPYALTAAEASKKICEENERIALDLERFVLPHNKTFQSAYHRFDVRTRLPYFEFGAKDLILAQTLQYLDEGATAEHMTRVGALLRNETFPSTWEDQITISSLSSLFNCFTFFGYNEEAELVSDSISNFILYEATKSVTDPHHKLLTAIAANKLAHCVRKRKSWASRTAHEASIINSQDFVPHSLMAFAQTEGLADGMNWNRNSDNIRSEIDIARRSFFVLSVARRRNLQEMQTPLYTSALRQLSNLIFKGIEDSRALLAQIENLLILSSLAVLCDAATAEALSDEPRIILSGPFVRHLSNTILSQDLQAFDPHILEPIANAISAIVRLGKWSAFRDPLITKLLSQSLTAKPEIWSLVNLAVEREHLRLVQEESGKGFTDSDCINLCKRLMVEHNPMFQQKQQDIALQSVDRGYLGLLRKLLEGDDLISSPRTYKPKPCATASALMTSISDRNGGNLLHRGAKIAYLPVQKLIVECLGTVQSKPALSKLDMDGLSPLHLACRRRGHLDTILLCIYAGAELDITSSEGRTALHYSFPNKEEIPDYLQSLLGFFQEHCLLITIPVEAHKIFGTYGAGQKVDNPTFVLRNIIRQLCCRGASTIIQDQWGASPGHLAAVNGWGTNVDMLFIRDGDEAEKMIQECLCVKDKENNSVLAAMRIAGDVHGEKTISAEMMKRCLYTSAADNPQTTPNYLHSTQYTRTASTASRVTERKPVAAQENISPSSSSWTENSQTSPTFPPNLQGTRQPGAVLPPASPPFSPIGQPYPPHNSHIPNQFVSPGYSTTHPPVAFGRQYNPPPPQPNSSMPIRPSQPQASGPHTNQNRQSAILGNPPQLRPNPDYRQQPPSHPPAGVLSNSQQPQPKLKNGKNLFRNVLKKL